MKNRASKERNAEAHEPGSRSAQDEQAPERRPDPRSLEPSNLLALQRTAGNRAVLRLVSGQRGGEAARGVARSGLEGSGGSLPHGDRIQESFGRFDVSGVKAHVGESARDANRALGAKAFTMGESVALKAPDLHTEAHEAAHVVQQRAGVPVSGGVGRPGDAHEKQADAIADRVVAGQSAEGLLASSFGPGAAAPQGAGSSPSAPLQMKLDSDAEMGQWYHYDADGKRYQVVSVKHMVHASTVTLRDEDGKALTVFTDDPMSEEMHLIHALEDIPDEDEPLNAELEDASKKSWLGGIKSKAKGLLNKKQPSKSALPEEEEMEEELKVEHSPEEDLDDEIDAPQKRSKLKQISDWGKSKLPVKNKKEKVFDSEKEAKQYQFEKSFWANMEEHLPQRAEARLEKLRTAANTVSHTVNFGLTKLADIAIEKAEKKYSKAPNLKEHLPQSKGAKVVEKSGQAVAAFGGLVQTVIPVVGGALASPFNFVGVTAEQLGKGKKVGVALAKAGTDTGIAAAVGTIPGYGNVAGFIDMSADLTTTITEWGKGSDARALGGLIATRVYIEEMRAIAEEQGLEIERVKGFVKFEKELDRHIEEYTKKVNKKKDKGKAKLLSDQDDDLDFSPFNNDHDDDDNDSSNPFAT